MIQIPVTIDRTAADTIQDQLVVGIRSLIVEGAIKPEMRLPATRALSKQLCVSRNTVKIVYCNLMDQGYLYSKHTSGTYVCKKLPDEVIGVNKALYKNETSQDYHVENLPIPIQEKIILGQRKKESYNFDLDGCDPTITPTRTWRRMILKHLPYRERYVNDQDIAGLEQLRSAIVNSVSPLRGMLVSADNTFVISDGYRAFDIVLQAILKRGSCVALESPCDSGIKYLCNRSGTFGTKLLPIPIDEEGIIVDQLPEYGVDLVYVSPSHQNPTGVTMSVRRREQLLQWAERTDAYIVECDTNGEFRYDDSPTPSLYALDTNQRVIYINSFSTWIGAGLNLGYLIVPPKLVPKVREVKKILHTEVSWLDQIVTAEFISSQSFFCHLRRVRHTYQGRRDLLIQSIEKHFGPQKFTGLDAGRHIVWHLPVDSVSANQLKQQAQGFGVDISILSEDYSYSDMCEMEADHTQAVFLGYAALQESSIDSAISCLKMASFHHSEQKVAVN